MYDEAWEELRIEARLWMKEREETLLKKWLNNIGYKEPIGYYRNICDNTMEIYSKRLGALIGVAGVSVEMLKKMLADEFGGEWKIKLVEVRGGFVQV